ncbi:hypothetical protein GGR92_005231 [Spirosoma lacussanchae]
MLYQEIRSTVVNPLLLGKLSQNSRGADLGKERQL